MLLTLALHSSIAQSEISFEWVTVGDPGNANDPLSGIAAGDETPPARGAVAYVYSLSKYETTIGQYTAFLNAFARSDPDRALSLYDSFLGSSNVTRGIARVSMAGKDVYYVKNLSSSREGWVSTYLPITFIDYLDAVRFVNWLHNGQGNGSTETGAYTIGQNGQITRSPDARFWIPTENEWYKAAYYDPSPQGPSDDYWLYPWRSDSAASDSGNYYVVRYYATRQIAFDSRHTYVADVRSFNGVPSYYGTAGQAGNVEEWTEGDSFSGGPHTRGGWWNRSFSDPVFPQTHAFQRMASYFARATAPDPSSEGRGFRVATGANPPGGGLKNGDFIRFHPRRGHSAPAWLEASLIQAPTGLLTKCFTPFPRLRQTAGRKSLLSLGPLVISAIGPRMAGMVTPPRSSFIAVEPSSSPRPRALLAHGTISEAPWKRPWMAMSIPFSTLRNPTARM